MMDTALITIEEGRVTIRPARDGVWLTEHEIARLFDVVVSAVSSNIRAILKNGALRPDEVCSHRTTPGGGIMILYNLEMVAALAFRLKSRQAQQFRRWLIRQTASPAILWKIPGAETLLN